MTWRPVADGPVGTGAVEPVEDPVDALGAAGVSAIGVHRAELCEERHGLSDREVVDVGRTQAEVGGQRGKVDPQCPPQVEGSVTTRAWPVSCQSIIG
jgi:hypothetical protein